MAHPTSADAGHSRTWVPGWPCAVGQVLRPQRRGAGDPTQKHLDDGRVWRAMRTPLGPASLCIEGRPSSGEVLGRAWGPGAEWALDRLPGLLGADDDPTGFEAHHPQVAEGLKRHPHWRIGGTGLVMESLVPSILEQKVTGKQAFGSFRELVRRHGEPAPGPVAALRLMLQPTPEVIAAIPSWEWLRLGVQPAQSRTMVTACRLASSLERVGQVSGEEADRRLRTVRGIGVWTSAEVRQRALGDADAVSFGDYHLANWVGWALVGHDITDDEMAELLEPYRPQRGRAAMLAIAGGQSRPRRGPRMSIPTHLPTH
ncbi:3-methyladenine DNA glycosylase/8-oxoguanine DNA glycosylase [Nocardioides exalbidus]|uniref:3-methyladenine DNA glycosylase/8-oxoguanine DNA glycosylase n=1 Tax=Nocardioides exalbidus TaxID=402596 RepID=A0A1H4Z6I4_9ACTN|nr:3-methyladenine DNA glycosylase [Nocardioides exalbidus]SED25809.1 3-methyladenine DNA glycosylase/8-oxoguanine DNA glycosylase [Nocardioides exalbidus]